MAFARDYPNAKAALYGPERKENAMFVLAITVQLLLICLSSQLVSLAEKIDCLFNKGNKLNLGLAALVLILAAYVCFWAQFGAQMNSLGVNLVLGACQIGSLYVAIACLCKLHESDDKSLIDL